MLSQKLLKRNCEIYDVFRLIGVTIGFGVKIFHANGEVTHLWLSKVANVNIEGSLHGQVTSSLSYCYFK